MSIILIRGLPGSGKSTLAKLIASSINAEHWETDMFWMKTGEYKFNPKALGIAHKWCQGKVAKAVAAGNDVVVSNVFSLVSYMVPYVSLAPKHELPTIIHVYGNFGNIHGAPPELVEQFKNEWQDVIGELCIFL